MTVYEWIMSKDGITVKFNKYIDGDYRKILKIRMDANCVYSMRNDDRTLTQCPITLKKLFMNDQIPHNDATMIFVLDQMYQDLIYFARQYVLE